MFGVWGAVVLQGNLKSLSPSLSSINWQITSQTRTRDDSSQGSRVNENLLFGQLGYQLNSNASLWIGYLHDWIAPLGKPSYQAIIPYQDFLWTQSVGDFNLIARTRVEELINQTTGNVGVRPRQLLQISHPLPFLDKLSVYLGDEVFFYVNQNDFGKQGFSENRLTTGLSYEFTRGIAMDLGYLEQYVDTKTGSNLFTHNLQTNVRVTF